MQTYFPKSILRLQGTNHSGADWPTKNNAASQWCMLVNILEPFLLMTQFLLVMYHLWFQMFWFWSRSWMSHHQVWSSFVLVGWTFSRSIRCYIGMMSVWLLYFMWSALQIKVISILDQLPVSVQSLVFSAYSEYVLWIYTHIF